MPLNISLGRWASRKSEPSGSLVGDDALMPFSYGMMLIAGSLLGFGALVSLGQPHRAAVVAEVAPAVHESHAAPAAHEGHAPAAHEERAPAETHAPAAGHGHAEPSHHEAAAHHEGGHEAAAHEGPDPAELARTQTREAFTDKVMSRFLSTDCDKNRHSETGVQFGVNSYSEFSGSKRTRYIEGGYRFEADGFKLIVADDNQLDFKMTGDTVSMTRVMVSGVVVPAPAGRAWKACRSDIHEPPLQAPKSEAFDPSDGLRFALAANDMEAATHYLALGGYVPATEFSAVVKAANLDGPISVPIREASRQNEDNALRRKAIVEDMEAKRKAAEAKRPKVAKPKADGKGDGKEKPKEGGGSAHH